MRRDFSLDDSGVEAEPSKRCDYLQNSGIIAEAPLARSGPIAGELRLAVQAGDFVLVEESAFTAFASKSVNASGVKNLVARRKQLPKSLSSAIRTDLPVDLSS